MRNADLSDVPRRTITSILQQQADATGDALFILDQAGATFTYHQFNQHAHRYARALRDLGVGPGDRVCLFMDNSAEMVLCCFAANLLGAAWSGLNTDYRGQWLGATFQDLGAKVLIVADRLLPRVEELDETPFEHIVVLGAQDGPAPPRAAMHDLASFAAAAPLGDAHAGSFGDPSAIVWTSGTTGRSKGVVQPHNAWLAWAEYHNGVYRDGIREGERLYTCLPMYNVSAWINTVFPALITGTPACIDKKFSVNEFWNRLRHYDAQHATMVGTMHLYLWKQPERADDRDNPLRALSMQPIIPDLVEPFKHRFGIELVTSGVGQSEVQGHATWRDDQNHTPGAGGFVNTSDQLVDVELHDDDDLPVALGEIGEICIRPRQPHVIFSGYLDAPDATIETARNYWHHTGDLGRMNERNELFFIDRKSDSTRHKGRNISSFEVEQIALGFPGITLAAVVGMRMPELEVEDELLLAVVPAEGAEIDPLALCQFIDSRAPHYFVPRFIHVTGALPMTPSQKVRKVAIREAGVPEGAWDLHAQAWRPTR